MSELLIGKKKYVVIPQKEYLTLQKKASLKKPNEKTFSIAEARAYSKKLINQWANEK